jgi:hypothetical protein
MKSKLRQEAHWQTGVPLALRKAMEGKCPETGKIVLAKKKQALTLASRAGKEMGKKMGVYKCEYCNAWHITTVK